MKGVGIPIEIAIQAVSHFAQSACQQNADRCHLAMAQLRIGAMTHIVDALVTRRADVIRETFAQLLKQYSDQARHYMAQQKTYADAEIETTDPLRRVELRARINKLDTELATLRIDSRQLYDCMSDALLKLGSSMRDVVGESSGPLSLPLTAVA
jgi:hypothetical protein